MVKDQKRVRATFWLEMSKSGKSRDHSEIVGSSSICSFSVIAAFLRFVNKASSVEDIKIKDSIGTGSDFGLTPDSLDMRFVVVGKLTPACSARQARSLYSSVLHRPSRNLVGNFVISGDLPSTLPS